MGSGGYDIPSRFLFLGKLVVILFGNDESCFPAMMRDDAD